MVRETRLSYSLIVGSNRLLHGRTEAPTPFLLQHWCTWHDNHSTRLDKRFDTIPHLYARPFSHSVPDARQLRSYSSTNTFSIWDGPCVHACMHLHGNDRIPPAPSVIEIMHFVHCNRGNRLSRGYRLIQSYMVRETRLSFSLIVGSNRLLHGRTEAPYPVPIATWMYVAR